MIDVDREELIDFNQATKHPAYRNPRNGKAAHVASVYRHVMTGARAVNGEKIKLEVVKLPSGLRTSREAISRFISRLTDPKSPATTTPSSVRTKQINAAEQELVEAGLMTA